MPGRIGARFFPAVALVVGCGGALLDPPTDGGGRRDGGRKHGGREDDSSDGASVDGGFPIYREDACPDVPMVPPPLECDPFAQSTRCRPGEACYPIPPRATDRCRPGTYSTACLIEGPGRQGARCEDATDCAGGFVCVTSGLGDLCLLLCRTGQAGACPDGLVCNELDVTGSGWGACG